VTSEGEILARLELPTEARRGPAAVLADVVAAARACLTRVSDVQGLGVACAGQIDPATGTVVYAPNLGWREVPLAGELARALGRPVTVENDVRAAAWGEYRFGAGRGSRTLLAVFVGTGVGSGAVLEGCLWRGASNGAGEVGHTQVVWDGLPCPCGQRGCLEQYVSGSGFQRRLARALATGTATALAARSGWAPERLTARMVYDAARAGDALAAEWWAEAERFLVLALANYVTLLNPEVLVVGGGVVETVPPLFEAVAAGVPERTTILGRRVRIERARLGDWSGAVGAAALAAAP
jgi:glucokinase